MDYHRTYGVDIRIARIFNSYGPRMNENDGRVVSNFIVQALKGKDITIYGDGSQVSSNNIIDTIITLKKANITIFIRQEVFVIVRILLTDYMI